MKQVHYIILTLLFLCVATSFIANPEEKKSPLKEIFSGLVAMPGGEYLTGEELPLSDELLKDTCLILLGNPKKSKMEPFLLHEIEVSIKQWKAFFKDKEQELGKEKAMELFYPDTICWNRDFIYSYNQPMVENYYQHPAYEDYPIVGVSWYQSKAYCEWLTSKANEILKENNINEEVAFRLPTSTEWEYAALSPHPDFVNSRAVQIGRFRRTTLAGGVWDLKIMNGWANFGKIEDAYGIEIKSYASDGHLFTGPPKFFPPNRFGLYDMAGNVAEWTSTTATIPNQQNYSLNDNIHTLFKEVCEDANLKLDSTNIGDRDFAMSLAKAKLHDIQLVIREGEKKVVKGGSWADPLPYLYCSAEEVRPPSKQTSRIGFRVAMTYNPKLEAFYKKLGIEKISFD